jgi:hypothetical protein
VFTLRRLRDAGSRLRGDGRDDGTGGDAA